MSGSTRYAKDLQHPRAPSNTQKELIAEFVPAALLAALTTIGH